MSDFQQKALKHLGLDSTNPNFSITDSDIWDLSNIQAGYDICQKEYEEKLRWIPVEEKEPESFKNDEDGIYYSKYLELKVKGYEYPLIGYYVNANDDQFFDIISVKDDEIKQEDITHYRECFL